MTTLPRGRGPTRADLAEMPDDGHRYELIDGTLVVTAAPSIRHQQVSVNLAVLMHAACPSDLLVLTAPTAVVLAEETEVQPDLLVAARSQFTEQELPGPPLLAVEILSPSTRLLDLNLKKARYEEAGCSSYWVVDPMMPRLTVWELVDDAYVQAADVTGATPWTAAAPFSVRVVPDDLLR